MNQPLDNIRHEKFCQLYSGRCYGFANRAYKLAGFNPKDDKSARSEGSKLLTNPNIWARIKHLREEMRQKMAIDASEILKLRLEIAKNRKKGTGDRLSALKDVERSLGLETPEKVELDIKGAVLVIE